MGASDCGAGVSASAGVKAVAGAGAFVTGRPGCAAGAGPASNEEAMGYYMGVTGGQETRDASAEKQRNFAGGHLFDPQVGCRQGQAAVRWAPQLNPVVVLQTTHTLRGAIWILIFHPSKAVMTNWKPDM